MSRDRTYCREHCKGFRDTRGRCFADGECEKYTEYYRLKNTMTPEEKKMILPENDAMILSVMNDFDFDLVHRTMVAAEWKWADTKNHKLYTPTKWEIMCHANDLLKQVVSKGTPYTLSCGGFEATRDEEGNLFLKFVVASAAAFTCDL